MSDPLSILFQGIWLSWDRIPSFSLSFSAKMAGNEERRAWPCTFKWEGFGKGLRDGFLPPSSAGRPIPRGGTESSRSPLPLGPGLGIHSSVGGGGEGTGAGPRRMSTISTGSDRLEAATGAERQRALQGQRQAAQSWSGKAELSSWAAVDTGKEAEIKCISFTTVLPTGTQSMPNECC